MTLQEFMNLPALEQFRIMNHLDISASAEQIVKSGFLAEVEDEG